MGRRCLIIAFFLIPIHHSTLEAYNLKEYSWNWLESTSKVVHLWINPNCADPSAPNELSAITNAYNTWSSVPTNFDFHYVTSSSVTNHTPGNNQNDLCWNSGSCPVNPDYLAVTINYRD